MRGAFLYWSVLSDAYSDDLARGIFNGVPITGELLGNDTSPCWTPNYVYSFRADVTELIFPQINGDYELTGFASGLTNGSNPWEVNEVPPLIEGASLVIVYHHPTIKPNRMVMIYDGPPVTFAGAFVNTTITGFSVGKTVSLKTTFIIADGQSNSAPAQNDQAWLQFPTVQFLGYTGDGRDVVDSTGTINTVTGWFHDTTTFDLTPYFVRGMNTATVALKTSSDCLTWLAQAFSANIN